MTMDDNGDPRERNFDSDEVMKKKDKIFEDILKLLDRIDIYNSLFPETAMRLVGLQIMSPTSVFPVFSQPFIDISRFATKDEIDEYMLSMKFTPTGEDGKYSNGQILLWDIKPKNVLVTADNIIAVIDAEIEKL